MADLTDVAFGKLKIAPACTTVRNRRAAVLQTYIDELFP